VHFVHVLFGFFGACDVSDGLAPPSPGPGAPRFARLRPAGSFASPEKRAPGSVFHRAIPAPLAQLRVQRGYRRKNPHPTAEKHKQPRPVLVWVVDAAVAVAEGFLAPFIADRPKSKNTFKVFYPK